MEASDKAKELAGDVQHLAVTYGCLRGKWRRIDMESAVERLLDYIATLEAKQ